MCGSRLLRDPVDLATTEAVAAVMAQVAIPVANRYRTATVAGWRVPLELGELRIPRILSDRCRRHVPNRRCIGQPHKLGLCVVGSGMGLRAISVDWGGRDIPLGSGSCRRWSC